MATEGDDKSQKKDILYNEFSIRNNSAILEYSRTSMSALSGGAAGILGLTGLYGFIFYFIASLALSIILWIKIGSDWNRYFISKWTILTNGLFGGLFVSFYCSLGICLVRF